MRQDISPEYQLVQAAHVALVMGSKLGDKQYDVSNLFFTVIGVPELKSFVKVQADLQEHGFECFYESDIGGEMTAIASYPIHNAKRGKLLEYKLLRFTFTEN